MDSSSQLEPNLQCEEFELFRPRRSGTTWSEPKVRQEVNTWKVRFAGSTSTTSIRNFLRRVEWHAARGNIRTDDLVGGLDLCLEGEALDWFWTLVDRHPGLTWDMLQQEMLLRFSASHSDDEVRRTMNDRKQRFPKEHFQEFYQAIMRIASQADRAITDNQVYTVLRRNMRPGLQIALHNMHDFRNLADFVRHCSSLEEVWRRLGNNPEIGISAGGQPSSFDQRRPKEGYQFPGRSQVRFNTRPPQVQEMTYLEMEAEEAEPACVYPAEDETPDFCEQVCEISRRLKSRSQEQGSAQHTPRKTVAGSARGEFSEASTAYPARGNKTYHCWNCGDVAHTFMECRRPVTGVFCYGCGRKGVYKLDCTHCTPPENQQREIRNYREPYHSRTRPNSHTEEAASNTDPELYRSWRRS